ncbi:MAG: spore coat protein U domain-containing protein [Alphaproteobacteria bacterium]|nr:spore coat protein U domain-containing protein [Alphaproteobacteria bacterium]
MLLGAFAASAPAAAQTDTFQVTATVNASCSVTATDLAFGVYDPFSATDIDGTVTLQVLCTNTTDYDIGLDEGVGQGATVAVRVMESGANDLTYSIYQNTQRTTVWGDTVGVDTVSDTGTGTTQTFTAYARLFALQNAAPGAYSDTVTVTVTF